MSAKSTSQYRDEWYKIHDPQTNSPFFLNADTKLITCTQPLDGTIMETNSEDEWWELIDKGTQNPYYYNTKTKSTEWKRPTTGILVPLHVAQNSFGSFNVQASPFLQQAVQENITFENINPPPPLETISESFERKSNRASVSSTMSTKTIPRDLKDEIQQFSIDGFARKFFQTKKRGFFRRSVPINKMMTWSKDMLTNPLLTLNKAAQKEALSCFKQILRIMGDRPGSIVKGSKVAGLEDALYIIEKGIFRGELRDEIYVQTCKQLTKNPNPECVRRGWELMCMFVIHFPPSKNFEEYLKSFILQNSVEDKSNEVLSKYAYRKLARICKTGPRGKSPTLAELERAKKAPYNPSVFGETLEDIKKMPNSMDPTGKYPKILDFLATSVLNLNGCNSEGIFRVPGDADSITELRLRIENGNYSLGDITEPSVPASLLKFWLRDLADPVIPAEFYNDCIKNAEAPNKIAEIFLKLPTINLQVIKYMIKFLRIISEPQNQVVTKMNVNNLAMVFAPNFLRCPSDSPEVIFENTKYEQTFLRTVILNCNIE